MLNITNEHIEGSATNEVQRALMIAMRDFINAQDAEVTSLRTELDKAKQDINGIINPSK